MPYKQYSLVVSQEWATSALSPLDVVAVTDRYQLTRNQLTSWARESGLGGDAISARCGLTTLVGCEATDILIPQVSMRPGLGVRGGRGLAREEVELLAS